MQSKDILDNSINELVEEIEMYKKEIDKLRIQLRKLKRIRKALGC